MAITFDPNCDYYKLLGIPPSSTLKQVRDAYISAVARVHPDVSRRPTAHEETQELNAARRVLSDPNLRAQYDAARQETYTRAQQAARRPAVVLVRYPPIRRKRRL